MPVAVALRSLVPAILLVLLSSSAWAGQLTVTWDGGGATNDYSDLDNWDLPIPDPPCNDALQFVVVIPANAPGSICQTNAIPRKWIPALRPG